MVGDCPWAQTDVPARPHRGNGLAGQIYQKTLEMKPVIDRLFSAANPSFKTQHQATLSETFWD